MGRDAAELLTGLIEVVADLASTGGLAWARRRGPPVRTPATVSLLELRPLVMTAYRDRVLREVMFNPSYEIDDIPAFLEPRELEA